MPFKMYLLAYANKRDLDKRSLSPGLLIVFHVCYEDLGSPMDR